MDAQAITERLGGIYRHGAGHAPCPICQPERRRDQNALSITDKSGKTLLYCFKSRCSFVEIANAIALPLGSVQIDIEAQQQIDAKRAAYAAKKLARARSLWDFGRPITGTKGETYLRSRGINIDLPDSLRWVADIMHKPSLAWCSAMVADVSTGGVHRTFFTKQGERLSRNAKMMLGPCCGGAVRLTEGTGPLVACEGIETGLSVAQILAERSPTVLAALSTSGIKGFHLPDIAGDLIVAADGDEPGREAANILAQKATVLGWKVSIMQAPDGQDLNDVLVSGGAI